jgi:hypothetical protein
MADHYTMPSLLEMISCMSPAPSTAGTSAPACRPWGALGCQSRGQLLTPLTFWLARQGYLPVPPRHAAPAQAVEAGHLYELIIGTEIFAQWNAYVDPKHINMLLLTTLLDRRESGLHMPSQLRKSELQRAPAATPRCKRCEVSVAHPPQKLPSRPHRMLEWRRVD